MVYRLRGSAQRDREQGRAGSHHLTAGRRIRPGVAEHSDDFAAIERASEAKGPYIDAGLPIASEGNLARKVNPRLSLVPVSGV